MAISQSNPHLMSPLQHYQKMRGGRRQEQKEDQSVLSSVLSISLSDGDGEEGSLVIECGEDGLFDLELQGGKKGKRRGGRQDMRQEWNPCIDQVKQPPNKIDKLFEQIRSRKNPKDKVKPSNYTSNKKKRPSGKQHCNNTQKDPLQHPHPTLSQKQLLRIISHHIQGILRTRKKIRMQDLIQELRLIVPERIKDKLSPQIASQALQMAQNPLGKYTPSGKRKTKLCSDTGVIKNQLDVEQYCKKVLDMLDTCKVVYFVTVEKLVQTNKNKLQYTSDLDSWARVEAEVARNFMYFRGVLGSNLQSYSDILYTSDTLESRNNSFRFLLNVLAKKAGPTQKYLFMTQTFMDEYGPSLQQASQLGFIFCTLQPSLKAFNPFYYWLRDLRLLAGKYQVKNSEQLRQILQYESCRFDKQVYSDYFRMVRRKMRKLVTSIEQGGFSAERQ